MIGILDSGIGGVSVLQKLLEQYPDLSFIYHADSLNAPYGEQTRYFLVNRVNEIINYIHKNYDINTFILACNTSSAVVFHRLEDQWKEKGITVYDIISAGVSEILSTVAHNTSIGLLATSVTVASGEYSRQLFKKGYPVHSVACPRFVPLIEKGIFDGKEIEDGAKEYLSQLFAANPNLEHVILGCTHYPFILQSLQKVSTLLGKNVTFHDPADTMCFKELENHLGGKQHFLTSGSTEKFNEQIQTLLHKKISSQHTVIE